MNNKEIKEYLEYKKYLLTIDEYLKLIENEQIRKVKYENGEFEVLTDDNYTFSFKIIDK